MCSRGSIPELPLADIRTLDEIAAAANAQRRFVLAMTALFAGAALLLAAVGAYGVLAWTVRQRTRELGVRVALGARRQDVLLLVLTHGGRLALDGIVVGSIAALASGRVLQALLYGVSPRDAAHVCGRRGAMFVIACLAAPARRGQPRGPIPWRRCGWNSIVSVSRQRSAVAQRPASSADSSTVYRQHRQINSVTDAGATVWTTAPPAHARVAASWVARRPAARTCCARSSSDAASCVQRACVTFAPRTTISVSRGSRWTG